MSALVLRKGRRGRWLGAAGVLVALGVAGATVVASDISKTTSPVSLVLTRSTIRAGGTDTVVALNKSINPLNTAGAAISPRTSTLFSTGPVALVFDDRRDGVAPYSKRQILQPDWSKYPPGKYWVWMAYAGSGNATLYAYTKLTIVAR